MTMCVVGAFSSANDDADSVCVTGVDGAYSGCDDVGSEVVCVVSGLDVTTGVLRHLDSDCVCCSIVVGVDHAVPGSAHLLMIKFEVLCVLSLAPVKVVGSGALCVVTGGTDVINVGTSAVVGVDSSVATGVARDVEDLCVVICVTVDVPGCALISQSEIRSVWFRELLL